MVQRREILFSTGGLEEGFTKKVVFELSFGAWGGFRVIERSSRGNSGKGDGINKGLDTGKVQDARRDR